MLYLRQGDYPDMEYKTRLGLEGPQPKTTIATSGCGLCCACMIVENLTTKKLTLEQAIQISYDAKANWNVGTTMRLLAPRLAELYDLEYRATGDLEELAEHLRRGGMAILNMSRRKDGQIGLFSKGGHFITAVSIDGDELCVLDPDFSERKFDIPERKGRVRVDFPFLYCALREIEDEGSPTAQDGKFIHLFRRKKPE